MKKIKSQENELEELFSQWVDVNDLFNDAVNGSYDQAVLAVSDVGLNKALQEAVNEIDQHLEWLMEPERTADFRTRKICRRTNTLPAEKYHWGNQEPSFKRNAVLLYPRGEKSGHGANQRRFSSVRFAKAAAAAGRNQPA